MKIVGRVIGAVAIAFGSTGCGGGNGGVEPSLSQPSLNSDRAQIAVGVATFSDGSAGLNVVATFRKPGGLAATLVNTPTIHGPFTVTAANGGGCPQSSFGVGLIGKAYLAGFAGLAPDYSATGASGIDANTHAISGSPQTPPGSSVACTTLGQGGGVFEYGFSLQNQTTSQTANVGPAFFYPQPLYNVSLQNPAPYLGGPPAYPNVQTGTYPAGFAGFMQGFLTFAIGRPPVGPYGLTIVVPAANAATSQFAASTNLRSATGLAAFSAAPAVSEDANADGGLSVAFAAPAGVTESIVDIVDFGPNAASGNPSRIAGPLFYTIVVRGSGPQNAVLPPNVGPITATGTQLQTIAPGDNYSVAVVGANYPLFESGPPQNSALTPALAGANGQCDLTFAPVVGNFTTVGYASTLRRAGAFRTLRRR